MKRIKTEEAIGQEDIPVLLRVGKDHIYIWECNEDMMHENDAALVLYGLCRNEHMKPTDVKEGKIELIAERDGVLKIDKEKLNLVNGFGEMMIASRHGNFPVKKGDKIAGTRIIPLVIEKEKMERVKKLCGTEPIFKLCTYRHKKVEIVTTGNEVFYGRIQDDFTPVIKQKLSEFDTEIIGHEICSDNHEQITDSILNLIERGAQMVICTGGMSVDPDDKIPLAIRNTGARMVTYGAPVLPGAMFLLAYYEEEGRDGIPVMGLPGYVMYAGRTVFDLVLPRIMTGEILEAEDFSVLGQGGLCLNCPSCTFPNCGFGKGV